MNLIRALVLVHWWFGFGLVWLVKIMFETVHKDSFMGEFMENLALLPYFLSLALPLDVHRCQLIFVLCTAYARFVPHPCNLVWCSWFIWSLVVLLLFYLWLICEMYGSTSVACWWHSPDISEPLQSSLLYPHSHPLLIPSIFIY